jgi:hypothetical protein
MARDFEPEWMIDPAGLWWVRVVPGEEPVRLIEPVEPAQVIEFPRRREYQEFRARPGG